MKTNHVTISVITPVYNREKLLSRCYQSLLKQSCYDFEWIIIDDGSTDGTLAVAESFEAPFEIMVLSKPNGGKHTALNASHPYIHGDYVLILDSDDTLIPSAVADVIDGWKQYCDQNEIGLVAFLRGTDENHPLCKAYDADGLTILCAASMFSRPTARVHRERFWKRWRWADRSLRPIHRVVVRR